MITNPPPTSSNTFFNFFQGKRKYIYGTNQSGCEKAKKKSGIFTLYFPLPLHWVFLTTYIVFALKVKENIYMGGTSQDVKRLKKKWDFYPLYFGFSWPFTIVFALMKHLPCVLGHVMSCRVIADTKVQLSDFELGHKLFEFLRLFSL